MLKPNSKNICNNHAHLEKEITYSVEKQAQIEKIRAAINSSDQMVYIPAVAHTFVDGNCCNDNASQAEVQSEIDYLNANYANHQFNVHVFLLSYNEHVDDNLDDTYGGMSIDQAIWDEYGVPNAINLFYMDFDNGGGSQHAYFPWKNLNGMVVVNQDYFFDGWSLIHELGHFWGILHTFESDGIADTPPCPNLEFGDPGSPATFYNEDDCANFYATYNDPNNGYTMSESVYENAMNYGARRCSQSWTGGQVDKMWERVPELIDEWGLYCNVLVPLNCPSTRVMNGIAYGQYAKASDKIESTQEIQASIREDFIGGSNEVILKPGFSANYGANVKINNVGCTCN